MSRRTARWACARSTCMVSRSRQVVLEQEGAQVVDPCASGPAVFSSSGFCLFFCPSSISCNSSLRAAVEQHPPLPAALPRHPSADSFMKAPVRAREHRCCLQSLMAAPIKQQLNNLAAPSGWPRVPVLARRRHVEPARMGTRDCSTAGDPADRPLAVVSNQGCPSCSVKTGGNTRVLVACCSQIQADREESDERCQKNKTRLCRSRYNHHRNLSAGKLRRS